MRERGRDTQNIKERERERRISEREQEWTRRICILMCRGKIHIFTKHNFLRVRKGDENLQIIIHCLIVIHNI